MPSRRTDDFADLKRILSAPAIVPAAPLLGEGKHNREDGSGFIVTWVQDAPGQPGWCWSNYWAVRDLRVGDWHGPFNTDHSCYLAALHKEQ